MNPIKVRKPADLNVESLQGLPHHGFDDFTIMDEKVKGEINYQHLATIILPQPYFWQRLESKLNGPL